MRVDVWAERGEPTLAGAALRELTISGVYPNGSAVEAETANGGFHALAFLQDGQNRFRSETSALRSLCAQIRRPQAEMKTVHSPLYPSGASVVFPTICTRFIAVPSLIHVPLWNFALLAIRIRYAIPQNIAIYNQQMPAFSVAITCFP